MSRKPFEVADRDLWEEVRRSVRPLQRLKALRDAAAPLSLQAPARPRPVAAIPVHKPVRHSPPELTGLDRRTEQRLMRGKVEIDARIDLHGTGLESARMQLLGFLHRARAEGARLVLVITGKGASPFSRHTLHGRDHFHSPEREGLIRRRATEWFHEPEFRNLVSGFQPAHPRHGGGGAFYVKIRRVRP